MNSKDHYSKNNTNLSDWAGIKNVYFSIDIKNIVNIIKVLINIQM